MNVPFIIFALPRSRTAWCSHYLSYKGIHVAHDTAVECASLRDFLRNFENGMRGCAETGAIIGWKTLRRFIPEAKFVTIHRPLSIIENELAKLGVYAAPGQLESRYWLLKELSNEDGVENFEFDLLNEVEHRRRLFEFCLCMSFDQEWDDQVSPVNIQIDMQARMRRLAQNSARLASLKAELSQLEGREIV